MFEDYWLSPRSWPRETREFVPMASAVLQVGAAIFGDDWRGDEPAQSAQLIAALPSMTLAKLHHRAQAHSILSRAVASYVPKPKNIKMPTNFLSREPVKRRDLIEYQFTEDEWEKAIDLLEKSNAIYRPAAIQFEKAKQEFLRAATFQEIETSVVEKGTANFRQINPDIWSLVNRNVFFCCEISPSKPNSIYATGSHHVFVSRGSLAEYVAARTRIVPAIDLKGRQPPPLSGAVYSPGEGSAKMVLNAAKPARGKTEAALIALSVLYPISLPPGQTAPQRAKAVNSWLKDHGEGVHVSERVISDAARLHRQGERVSSSARQPQTDAKLRSA